MHLVDDENDVAHGLDLADEAFHAAFKLAPELGPGDQGRHVQQIDLLAAQLEGDGPRRDALGQPLGDGRLADARLADEAGVVLLPPVEDLDDPFRLDVPANDPVQLPASGLVRQVQAVLVKEFMLLALAGLGAVRALIRRCPSGA